MLFGWVDLVELSLSATITPIGGPNSVWAVELTFCCSALDCEHLFCTFFYCILCRNQIIPHTCLTRCIKHLPCKFFKFNFGHNHIVYFSWFCDYARTDERYYLSLHTQTHTHSPCGFMSWYCQRGRSKIYIGEQSMCGTLASSCFNCNKGNTLYFSHFTCTSIIGFHLKCFQRGRAVILAVIPELRLVTLLR